MVLPKNLKEICHRINKRNMKQTRIKDELNNFTLKKAIIYNTFPLKLEIIELINQKKYSEKGEKIQ